MRGVTVEFILPMPIKQAANLETPRWKQIPVLQRIFPVIPPVISLLVPCYDFMPKAIYASVYAEMHSTPPFDSPNSL